MDILLSNMASEGWNNDDIMATLLQTYGAGIDTSSNTSVWFIAHMIKYPEIQKKVQNELDRVVGRDRLPSYDDMQNLPYFNAVLNEVMRIKTIAPQALLHRVTEDFEVAKYKFKKNMLIYPNIYNICHSTKYWNDPESFIPERFLNWDPKNLAFSPFGYGPRSCAGTRIAKVNMFYLLTFMLQRFEFYTDDNDFQLPSYRFILVLTPDKLSVKIKKR